MPGRRRLVVVGNPGSRRTALLAEAVARFPGLSMELVAWVDLIAGTADLRRVVRDGDVVRLDSPGKDAAAERALLRAGAREPTPDGAIVSAARIESYAEDRGRIRWPAQWYAGLDGVCRDMAGWLAACEPHRLTVAPTAVRLMFDKQWTNAALSRLGVPVPPALLIRPESYDDLIGRATAAGWPQVFVKLRYGSSGSGAVAIRLGRRGEVVAYTTVEVDGTDRDGRPRLYNTRRIRRLTTAADVAAVVDALAPHFVVAERWLPKAGIDGRAFDLRVLVIDGRARHVVPRLSSSPMTNLHLLNRRGDADRVRRAVGEARWAEAMAICERAVAAFPGTLHAGVDLMFQPGFRRPTVLEVNAFGDLLPGVLHEGMDPYTAELAAVFGRPTA